MYNIVHFCNMGKVQCLVCLVYCLSRTSGKGLFCAILEYNALIIENTTAQKVKSKANTHVGSKYTFHVNNTQYKLANKMAGNSSSLLLFLLARKWVISAIPQMKLMDEMNPPDE